MNLMETASNLGLGLAAVIISVFLDHDLRLLAVFSSILLAGAAMLLLFFPPSLSSSPRARVSSHDSSLSSHASSMRLTLLTVFCSLFFVGLIISQLGSTYSLFVHHAFPHYHLGGFGWLFALNTFLVVLLQTPLACHLRRYPPVLIMGAGAFLLGSGMFTLIFALHFSLVILACLLYTTGEMLFFSVAQLICYEQAPADKKGLVLGGYRLVYAVSRILGPAAGSYLYEGFGAACLWFVCGLIGTVCLAAAVIYHYYIEELIPMQPLTNGASAANRAPE
ncbi:hypothetical protein AQUSIP_04810 [Aquicella siphonis]|uniref:Major facilitator superfamily (MFS) profile domain-containing protein n=1 Tax=Aquicella siphonis TaxID=254247 RepID=A0A5E4PED5_9COXI|nr:hypothetical protein AQUSIP_04810 [Aquicella siphonis]